MATLVAFHAHPDDESISMGGTMARAAAAGHKVVVVTATDGAVGEVADDFLDDGESLEARRAIELQDAARLLGIDRMGLGALTVGGPADVTVIDPRLEWTIRSDEFATTGRNCPFEGLSVRGRAIATIVAGEMRMNRASARVRVGSELE